MTNGEDTFAGFAAMLRQGLGERLSADADNFVDMMAEEGLLEFPYGPPGLPNTLKGRSEVLTHLSHLGNIFEINTFSDLKVHETKDPDVVILEFSALGRGKKTGEPYDQTYISVVTVRDGHIRRYVDYWNPTVATQAAGGLEALVEQYHAGRS